MKAAKRIRRATRPMMSATFQRFPLSIARIFSHNFFALPRILAIFLTMFLFLTGEAFALVKSSPADVLFRLNELRDEKALSSSYGANGKYEEPNGLLNEGHRYRDRSTNTFLTRDPLGYIDGPNDYNYVRHNPWSAWDPLGLSEENLSEVPSDTSHIGYVGAIGRYTLFDLNGFQMQFGTDTVQNLYSVFQNRSDLYTNLGRIYLNNYSYEPALTTLTRIFAEQGSGHSAIREAIEEGKSLQYKLNKEVWQYKTGFSPWLNKTIYRMDVYSGSYSYNLATKTLSLDEESVGGVIYLVPVYRKYEDTHPYYWIATDSNTYAVNAVKEAVESLSITLWAGAVSTIGQVVPFSGVNRISAVAKSNPTITFNKPTLGDLFRASLERPSYLRPVSSPMKIRVPASMRGNPELARLIREVSSMPVSASEKVRLFTEGASKIDKVNFHRIYDVPGTEGVFRGAPIPSGPMQGRSPVLAVLKDGRVVKGFDKPHPFGKPYNIIDLNDLK